MQISRFCVKSAACSEDGLLETLHRLPLDETLFATSARPVDRKDRSNENMSTNSFTQCKVNEN